MTWKFKSFFGVAFSVTIAAMLSSIAGISDAIGFSQTGEFVSFMSGNSTRMAISLSNGDITRGYRLLAVIALFVFGNTVGVIIARISGQYKRVVLMLYVTVLLALAAALPAVSAVPDRLGLENLPGFPHIAPQEMTLPSLVILIFAMAGLNSIVESIAGVGLSLTFVTGALAKLGRGLGNFIMGERRLDWLLQLGPWLGLVVGALVGNRLDNRFGRDALWLPSALSALIAVVIAFSPEAWLTHAD
jgi:uncharacterized membrane protein YoaK (UPF0700 family)